MHRIIRTGSLKCKIFLTKKGNNSLLPSFNEHLFITHVLSTVLGVGDTAVNKAAKEKSLEPCGVTTPGGGGAGGQRKAL